MVLYLVGTLFIIVCVLLIVVVLLQKGRGGGLGAAFGGAGSSAFGTRIGDVFTWVTIVLTALFLLLAMAATAWFHPAADQVGRPFFSPPPEQMTEPFPIQIGSATPEAQIHYTLDGSEPTEASPLYEGPVRVEPGTTVKARGYRGGGWTPSPVEEMHYGPTADTQPATVPAEGEVTPATQTAPAEGAAEPAVPADAAPAAPAAE